MDSRFFIIEWVFSPFRRFGSALFFLFLVACIPLSAFSQFEEEFEKEIITPVGEWVMTAGKRPQSVAQAPAAVTVITAEDIRNSGATNLGDLLRRVPGLEVMIPTPSDPEIGARGQNRTLQNGVLVLVDGRPIYQDFLGNVVWNKTEFPLEQIARIEVVRGPGSVLYGANALHAVVNIITKTPADLEGSLVSLTAGEGTLIGSFLNSGKSRNVAHLVSVGWTQFGSFSDPDEIVLQYPRSRAVLVFDLGQTGVLRFEGGVEGGDQEAFYDKYGMIKGFSVSHNVAVKYTIPNFYVRFFWNSIDASRIEVPEVILKDVLPEIFPEELTVEGDVKNHVADLEIQKVLELGPDHLVTAGTSYRYNTIESLLIEHYETQHLFAAYLQYEFFFRELLHSYLGARYDYHPRTGHNVSPRGSLIVSPLRGHTFRLSAGQSFRNPTYFENYITLTFPTLIGDIDFRGSPDLEPEELISSEVGYYADLFQNRLGLTLNLFYNEFRNIILPGGALTPPDFAGTFSNIEGEKEAKGLEAEIKAKPYPWLETFVNYSYTDVYDYEWDEKDRTTPDHKVNAGITAMLTNGFSSTVLVHYVGETDWPPNFDRDQDIIHLGPVDSYFLLNLRLAYRFWHDRAEAALAVFNLMDDSHQEFPLTDYIGRRITGKVSVNF